MAVSRRSTMLLYSKCNDIYSHQIQIVLEEKQISFENTFISEESGFPDDLLDLNPHASLPMLLDRELVLYEPRIIMEYLDERFPHPPLLPVYPIARAESRKIMFRLEKDWYQKYFQWIADNDEQTKRELQMALASISQIFTKYQYFMSDEFTLVDAMMSALLWRLRPIIPRTAATKPLRQYAERLFQRASFKACIELVNDDIVAA